MEVAADGNAELGGSRDQSPDLRGHGDADRVGEEEGVGTGSSDLCGELDDPVLVDPALERAAEGHAHGHRRADRVGPRTLDDLQRRLQRLLHRSVLISPVERLRRAEREPNLVQPGRDEAVVSALVQRKSRVHDSVDSIEGRNDLFRAGHLRNTARIDEARDLDGTQPGSRELADELGAERRRQDVRLVLEPVARAHVDDEHGRSA